MFISLSFGYLFLILTLLFFLCWFYRLPFFNAFSILLFTVLPFELTKVLIAPFYNGLSDDPYYLEAIGINLFFLTVAFFSLVLWLVFFGKVKLPFFRVYDSVDFMITKKSLRRSAYGFLLMYVVFFVATMVLGGGGLKWIFNTREAYQLHRVGVGMFYALSISFLSLSFGSYMFSFVRTTYWLYWGIIFYVGMAYFFGSKGMILDFAVFGLVALWFYRAKGFYLCLILVPSIVFPVMIYNLSQAYGELDLSRVLSYFDYYNNSAMFYKAFDEGGLSFYWGKIFTSQFWTFVPRFFYPEKPFVYGFLYVNEYFFPGAAAATNTPAFGGPTEFYADFGMPGVIFGALLNPAVICFAFLSYNLVYRFKYTSVGSDVKIDARVYLLLVFLFFPDFMLFFNATTKVLVFFLWSSYMYFSRRRVVLPAIRS